MKNSSTLRRLDLSEEALPRTLWSLAAPAITENLLLTVVFFSDTLIIGWLRDEVSLASAVLAGTVMWVVSSPFYALAVAATSLVARNWGEHEFTRARDYAAQSLGLAFMFALVTLVIAWPLTEQMLRLMGGEPEVARLGGGYLRILLLSGILGLPMFVSNSIIRGIGDTKTPMYLSLIMNLVNVIVSIVLAFGIGPWTGMGLPGVAWGTVVARSVGGLLSLRVLNHRDAHLRVPLVTWFAFSRALLRRVWRLAFPAFMERVVNSGSHIIFIAIVAMLGTTALAAHNIALNVESLAYLPAMGAGMAIATLVGQAIGARLPRIAEKGVRKTLWWGGIFMMALGACFVIFARQFVVIFGATPPVLRLAGIVLQISALEHPLMAFNMILAGALRGAGDTKSPLYVMTINILIFRFGGSYLFAVVFGWGLVGIWLATALDWGGRSLGLWWVFRHGGWALIHEREKREFDQAKV
ncbi:MAG: MATE family efflux transporter [bacterium]